MKLWLISQNVNNNYDTFDSAVVAAETEQKARETYPSYSERDNGYKWNGTRWDHHCNGQILDLSPSCWTTPDNVSVQFLADGYNGPAGTVLASFNAG
jgi:hypothetical protein